MSPQFWLPMRPLSCSFSQLTRKLPIPYFSLDKCGFNLYFVFTFRGSAFLASRRTNVAERKAAQLMPARSHDKNASQILLYILSAVFAMPKSRISFFIRTMFAMPKAIAYQHSIQVVETLSVAAARLAISRCLKRKQWLLICLSAQVLNPTTYVPEKEGLPNFRDVPRARAVLYITQVQTKHAN